nr:immunoglobulin light chain junction region [Macaca mulatta]
CMQTLDLPYSF